MISSFTRTLAALGAVASLVACSGGGAVVPFVQHGTPLVMGAGMEAGAARSQTSPCNVPKGWYFRGSCLDFSLNIKGETVTLGAYHGISITEHIGPNSAYPASHNSFVVGMGTSDKDITGKSRGFVFPKYGSVECVAFGAASTPCKGKGFLYSVMLNDSDAMGMSHTPTFRVSYNGALPGTSCEEAMIGYSFSTSKFFWVETGVYGKPQNGTVTFKPARIALTFEPKASLAFAFHCY
jgi:hypothetical protein